MLNVYLEALRYILPVAPTKLKLALSVEFEVNRGLYKFM